MPYLIEKRDDQWCVITEATGKTHGCHDTRAEAVKQQRALYKNAPPSEETSIEVAPEDPLSDASATMSAVKIPVKDMALLRMAVKRSEEASEQEVTQAISIASGLSDPEVAAQTVAVIGHLADRLRTAELNQAALVDVLQAVAADSTSSRNALLEALSGITERLAEAPQVNVTVPTPDVYVNVEQAGKRVVNLERDSEGRLVGATTGTRTIELERDSTGKLVGATVEEEGANAQEAA
jgi:YD repeat-containing protein